MADIGQIDMGKMMRRYSEEETVRIMKEIMENNEMMLKLQKQIGKLQIAEKKEKRRQVELYKYNMVYATTISTYPNVHALSLCPITHPL